MYLIASQHCYPGKATLLKLLHPLPHSKKALAVTSNFSKLQAFHQIYPSFPQYCPWFHNCLFPINTSKVSWFAITHALTYAYMYIAPYTEPLVYGNNSLLYNYCIATSLAVMLLYHQIPLYNKLTITSRPKVCHNSFFCDFLIIS